MCTALLRVRAVPSYWIARVALKIKHALVFVSPVCFIFISEEITSTTDISYYATIPP